MKHQYTVPILILLLSLLGTCCVQYKPLIPSESRTSEGAPLSLDSTESWTIPPDKLVFIEHRLNTAGENIDGVYPRVPFDSPGYEFDSKNGTLMGIIRFSINESLLLIYGSDYHQGGDYGIGGRSSVTGVYSLPYQSCGMRGLEYSQCREVLRIISVDANGTTSIGYKNQTFSLMPGEQWLNSTQRIETGSSNRFNYTTMEREKYYYTIKLTDNDTITNYGILEKTNIYQE